MLITDLPSVLSGGHTGRPWDAGEFDPDDVSKIEGLDGDKVARSLWTDLASGDIDPDFLPFMKPFGADYPGLAPAEGSCGNDLGKIVSRLQLRARIGLVGVRRPADVLTRIGWQGPLNVTDDMTQYSALLRSWEDRFGAYVVSLGFATMYVAIERVPQQRHPREQLAAELFSLAYEQDGRTKPFRDIADIADQIAGNALWEFWWD